MKFLLLRKLSLENPQKGCITIYKKICFESSLVIVVLMLKCNNNYHFLRTSNVKSSTLHVGSSIRPNAMNGVVSVGWSSRNERREREQEENRPEREETPGNPRAISPRNQNILFFYYVWPAMQAHLSWQRPDDKELPGFDLLEKRGLIPISFTSTNTHLLLGCFHYFHTRYSFHRILIDSSATSHWRNGCRTHLDLY